MSAIKHFVKLIVKKNNTLHKLISKYRNTEPVLVYKKMLKIIVIRQISFAHFLSVAVYMAIVYIPIGYYDDNPEIQLRAYYPYAIVSNANAVRTISL